MARLLFVSFVLTGCGLFGDESTVDWAKVHATANDARRDVNTSADTINAAVSLLDLVCEMDGVASDPCATLHDLHDGSKAAAEAARAAIDAYDATGIGAEQVEVAIAKVRGAALVFAQSARQFAEVVHGLDRSPGDPGASGSEAPAAPEAAPENRAAPVEGTGNGQPVNAAAAPATGAP